MLAVSDEAPATVDEFLEREGHTVRTAAGSRSSPDWGVSGIPASFLVGPDGKLLWSGHPTRLTRAKVEELLDGARAPGATDFLGVDAGPGARVHAVLEPAVEAASAGRLAASLEAAQSVAESEGLEPATRAAASALARNIEQHVALLSAQAEKYAADRDPLPALEILDGLAYALADSPAGKAVVARRAELSKDADWKAEVAAARALEAAVRSAKGAGRAAAKRSYQAVADEHPGTYAAKRARRRTRWR